MPYAHPVGHISLLEACSILQEESPQPRNEVGGGHMTSMPWSLTKSSALGWHHSLREWLLIMSKTSTLPLSEKGIICHAISTDVDSSTPLHSRSYAHLVGLRAYSILQGVASHLRRARSPTISKARNGRRSRHIIHLVSHNPGPQLWHSEELAPDNTWLQPPDHAHWSRSSVLT
jgi:hypothetical protein